MKTKNHYIWPIIAMVLVMNTNPSIAQLNEQVVTREISKIIEWTPGMSMMLNGENAEINCTSHQANTVEIALTIISKHGDRSRAEADLKKMKWLTEVKNNVLYVRNYIELGRNESKPQSTLKVIYNIKVPENFPMDIRDYFGKIHVENLNSTLNIKSEFSQINLNEISGVTTVNTVFGNLRATGIPGDLSVTSNRSDIDISGLGGKLNITSTLAKISLCELNPGATVGIDAEKSFIDLKINESSRYTYQFDLINSSFKKPAGMFPDFSKNDQEAITASYNTSGNFPVISVNLKVGSLTIEKQ
jgi:hypothetical protein